MTEQPDWRKPHDSQDLNTNHPAWQKIKQMYERGDFETLERMIDREEAWAAMGRMGKMFQTILLWFGSMIAIFFAVKSFIDSYIGKVP